MPPEEPKKTHADVLREKLAEAGSDLFLSVETKIIVRVSKGEKVWIDGDVVRFRLLDGREFSLPAEMVENFGLITSLLRYDWDKGVVEWESAHRVKDPEKQPE